MRRVRIAFKRTVMETLAALRGKLSPVPAGKYLLGLSGGADSVALLLMLLPAVRAEQIRLEAVHVNHGLRGHESDEDERFCKALCRKESVPLYTCSADLSGKRDEASAREARYAVFRKRYEEYGADALILAHQADDQAETFMMRLLRGAGPDGLACMKEDETVGNIRILRPMLSMRRDEIRNALRESGVPWREDASNHDLSYLRNRVRQELVPMLTRISSSAVDKICSTASLIGEDNQTLNAQAVTILHAVSDGRILDADRLAREETSLRRRTLRLWWNEQGPAMQEHALSFAQTEALDNLLERPKGKINLPGGMNAIRTGRYLFMKGAVMPVPEPVPVTGDETVFGEYLLKVTPSEGNPGNGKTTQEVPAGHINGCVIRTRRPGDRIRPFGSTGSRKLQDYLTDRRIEEPFRDQIPLLCRGNEVLLVCGVGAGNIPSWDQHQSAVRLTWYGKTPWYKE